jgi:hypothetical protein
MDKPDSIVREGASTRRIWDHIKKAKAELEVTGMWDNENTSQTGHACHMAHLDPAHLNSPILLHLIALACSVQPSTYSCRIPTRSNPHPAAVNVEHETCLGPSLRHIMANASLACPAQFDDEHTREVYSSCWSLEPFKLYGYPLDFGILQTYMAYSLGYSHNLRIPVILAYYLVQVHVHLLRTSRICLVSVRTDGKSRMRRRSSGCVQCTGHPAHHSPYNLTDHVCGYPPDEEK